MVRPRLFFAKSATREAAYAVSSPPMVTRCVTPSSMSVSTTFRSDSSLFVGLNREIRRMLPPSEWIRLTASMVRGITFFSPFPRLEKPS
ncbi:MAG: hypothetical protein BWY99_02899 [Synergistetes bacterium ADurb.BinA166]|nr:MAG: hypothetical protein BWY99_02899 [Synergistetes bacterium ADurb.BinA166]